MAQFKVFSSNNEVSGWMLRVALEATPIQDGKVREIFKKHRMLYLDNSKWYSMQGYLDAIQEVYQSYGPNLLFQIGKQVLKNSRIPGEANNLEVALNQLDYLYQYNHRGNEIGYYRLLNFNKERKEAQVECRNPYPCYLDRGILTSLSKTFKPMGASLIHVELNSDFPSRLSGNDRSFYNIIWI